MESKARIREFLEKCIRADSLEDDLDIFATGLASSIFVIELVVFIEKEFGLSIRDEDLDPTNFASINALAAFVARKKSGG